MNNARYLLAVLAMATSSVPSFHASAQAAPPALSPEERWTLAGVSFSNATGDPRFPGGSMSGWFTLDTTTHALLSWSFSSTAGFATCLTGGTFGACSVPGHDYQPGNSWSSTPVVNTRDRSGSPLVIVAGLPGAAGFPMLGLTLTAFGDPNRASVSTNAGEEWGRVGGSRGIMSGFAERASAVSPVPEPQIYATMLAGLAILALIAHRRRRWAAFARID
jgi:MYXO-CTERM domain-containing protein